MSCRPSPAVEPRALAAEFSTLWSRGIASASPGGPRWSGAARWHPAQPANAGSSDAPGDAYECAVNPPAGMQYMQCRLRLLRTDNRR